MDPQIKLIKKLMRLNSIKNQCPYDFLQRHNLRINLVDFVCYTIGNYQGEKYINCFKFLGESCCYKLRNYYIRWWNNATFESINNNTIFSSVDFWVHSGMTLRKNFFNYDDRMSLYRTTFIYDENSDSFFRLSYISSYLVIPSIDLNQTKVYKSIDKYNYIEKRKKNKRQDILSQNIKNPQILEIQKKLSKIINNKIYKFIIKKQNTKLFEEITNFINL